MIYCTFFLYQINMIKLLLHAAKSYQEFWNKCVTIMINYSFLGGKKVKQGCGLAPWPNFLLVKCS